MAQNTVNYANNPTGPELLDDYLAKEQENILSSNSGIQRPSYALAGTHWIDTSVTPWLYKIYDGSNDVTLGAIDSTTHSFTVNGVEDSNFVHKTGDETISDVKTFYKSTSGGNLLQSTGATTSGSYVDFIQQINGARRGTMRTVYNSNGSYSVFFGCNGPQADAPTGLKVSRDTNDVTTVTAPTPTDTTQTNSYQIDTVGARNTRINDVLAALYPVGSIYIGTQSTCPLASLISGSTWTKVSQNLALYGSSSSHAANTTIAAGLPNITGKVGFVKQEGNPTVREPSGAFSSNGESSSSYTQGDATGTSKLNYIKFSAQSSNSIYGNSSTVQPPAYVVNVWRRTA